MQYLRETGEKIKSFPLPFSPMMPGKLDDCVVDRAHNPSLDVVRIVVVTRKTSPLPGDGNRIRIRIRGRHFSKSEAIFVVQMPITAVLVGKTRVPFLRRGLVGPASAIGVLAPVASAEKSGSQRAVGAQVEDLAIPEEGG